MCHVPDLAFLQEAVRRAATAVEGVTSVDEGRLAWSGHFNHFSGIVDIVAGRGGQCLIPTLNMSPIL